MRRKQTIYIAFLSLGSLFLAGCGFGDTKLQAEQSALIKVQERLDDFRTEFVQRLDTDETGEELRSSLLSESFGLDLLVGMSGEELRGFFGDHMSSLFGISGSGDEVRLDTFFASRSNAGGGGSYEDARLYFCAEIVGRPRAQAEDLTTTVVPCSDVVRKSLTLGISDTEVAPDQIE
ncbi:MAG: hypothetical protein ACOH2T_28995 [Pseudomonas sp.]